MAVRWIYTLACRELGYDLSEVERNHLKAHHGGDDSSESEIEVQEVWLTNMSFMWLLCEFVDRRQYHEWLYG